MAEVFVPYKCFYFLYKKLSGINMNVIITNMIIILLIKVKKETIPNPNISNGSSNVVPSNSSYSFSSDV